MERKQIWRGADGLIDAEVADAAWPGDPTPGRDEEGGTEGGTDGGTSYHEARRRKELALARLREFEVAEREGTMVHVDDMEELLAAPLYRLRAKLLGLPSKWAPSLVGCRTIAEAQARLEAAIEEAMVALSEEGDEDEYDDAA